MIYRQYVLSLMNMNYFSNISKDEIESWFYDNRCNVKKYKRGQIIYLHHNPCTSTDIIMTGTVSIQKIDENGNILTVATLSKNSMLGGTLIFSEKNIYPMTVSCTEDCTLISLDRDLILELCQKHQSFLLSFLELLSNKTLFITNRLRTLTHKTIRKMITDYLTYEYKKQKSLHIKLYTTKKALAENFGVQRPSLSRELKKMRNAGLIEYDSKSITIKNTGIIGL